MTDDYSSSEDDDDGGNDEPTALSFEDVKECAWDVVQGALEKSIAEGDYIPDREELVERAIEAAMESEACNRLYDGVKEAVSDYVGGLLNGDDRE